MLDLKFIRENPDMVKEKLRAKQANVDVDAILYYDKVKREILTNLELLRVEQKKVSQEIVSYNEEKKRQLITLAKELSDKIKDLEIRLKEVENSLNKLLFDLPNLPQEDVPIGKDESENVVIKKWGIPKSFDFPIKDHISLGESLDIIDLERASKLSGSRFYYLKRESVLLQFALINFVLDLLTKENFIPVIPPVLAKEENYVSMGYLPQLDQEMYKIAIDELRLAATSEQTIGPMYKDEILSLESLPLRFVGFSSCFRREAGSYGKDTKGIFRVHQFDKVEMFIFCKKEDSIKEHEYLLSLEEKIMQSLGIPYQVVLMCTGDLGFPVAKKYDIEAWIPSQTKYRETHSTSNCTDFQSRRLGIRYREGKKINYVHTLNGTAIAISRMLIAILENYQQFDGSVRIPDVLRNYTGFSEIKR